jgi:hypothetical protein
MGFSLPTVSAADAATLRCKLAKASLLGERQSEGVYRFMRSGKAYIEGASLAPYFFVTHTAYFREPPRLDKSEIASI